MSDAKRSVDPKKNSDPSSEESLKMSLTMSLQNPSIETSLFAALHSLPSSQPQNEPAMLQQFGRYKIEKLLGKGAMGVVYLAEDSQLGRKIALKIPKKSALEDPEALQRFYREAQTTSQIRHPNICPVFDVGDIDGTHYLTMAYIPGWPISRYLKKGKLPQPRQVALLIRKIALALEEAHKQGVIHRDLKPSNIMLDDRSEPIVMDFGLACQINSVENARLTQSGAILGTPAYMSPEQVRGELDLIGPASDIYALGVLLYQFLCGELPFSGPILMVFAQVLTEQPKKPSELRTGVDPNLEAICLKMMAKEISLRYASMKDVAEALKEFLKNGPSSGPSPTNSSERPEAETSSAGSSSFALLELETLPPLPGLVSPHSSKRKSSSPPPPSVRNLDTARIADIAKRHWIWPMSGLASFVLFFFGSWLFFTTSGSHPPQASRESSDPLSISSTKNSTNPTSLSNPEPVVNPVETPPANPVPVVITPASPDSIGINNTPQQQPVPERNQPMELPVVAEKPDEEDGFRRLFVVDDSNGWSQGLSETSDWQVDEDGVLIGECHEERKGGLATLSTTRTDYADFHFRCETMLSDGGSPATILFRQNLSAMKSGDISGYGCLIGCTTGPSSTAEDQTTGTLVKGIYRQRGKVLGTAPALSLLSDHWFTLEFIVKGAHFTVLIDGTEVIDCSDSNVRPSGAIALLCRPNTVVRFRNIEIKEFVQSK